ncbi:MAG: DUF1449 family protein [Planctomycetales bacterium]|nr:DUF1449 family protein [Planctomycetales bacterium]
MNELYEAAFAPANMVYTVALIVMTAYWLIAIVGLVDIDAFDIDLDVDYGAELDLDADAGDVPGLSSQSLLGFLNVGEIPVMAYVSLVVLSMWVVSIQMNYYLADYGIGYQTWFAIALFVPNLIFGLLIAKAITTPIKQINKKEALKKIEMLGKPALVTSLSVDKQGGQCEVGHQNPPIVINAVSRDGDSLQRGTPVEIRAYNPDNNTYVVVRHAREGDAA